MPTRRCGTAAPRDKKAANPAILSSAESAARVFSKTPYSLLTAHCLLQALAFFRFSAYFIPAATAAINVPLASSSSSENMNTPPSPLAFA
jgi:hypothetical protein